MKKLALFFVLFGFVSFSLYSQVRIYPMVVYIDPILRSGEMTVMNPADQEKEVEVSLRYGYPTCDSLGNMFTTFTDSLTAGTNSLVPYVSIFPKRIIIPAKGEQTIRFMLRNVQNLPDNTYWARIITSSVSAVKQLDSTADKDKINIGINLKIEMATAIIYQKGKVNTNLKMQSLRSEVDSANVNLFVNFERSGTSPAFGTCYVKIKDENDKLVEELKETFSVYFSTTKAFRIERSKLKPGNYKAEFEYTNEQNATPDNYRLNFAPFRQKFDFKVD